MADTYPKNKIGDVEAPKHRPIDPRNAYVIDDLVAPRIEEDPNQEPRQQAAEE